MTADLDTFRLLFEALALGLLLGGERYRRLKDGKKSSAGVRTFAIYCLLGAVCSLLGTPAFTTVTFSAVAALTVLSYWRSSAESLGLTTEVAALLTFWIGYLLGTNEIAAIGLGVVLTIMLASKSALHSFVRDWISDKEFAGTLEFLAVVLVIYPILPDRDFGPLGFLNPRQAWGFVILVSTISYAGYFLVRWLGQRRGLLISSLAGALVSTTAVTASLAGRAKESPEASRRLGVVAVLANAVQGPRLLLLIWIVNAELARALVAPLLGMTLAGFAGGWLLSRRLPPFEIRFPLQNPYSILPAMKFGLFLVGILFVIKISRLWLGEQGVLLASAIAGTGSVSAVALSISDLLGLQTFTTEFAAGAIIAAITANAVSKCILAWLQGTWRMALWLAGGLASMLAAAYLLLLARI